MARTHIPQGLLRQSAKQTPPHVQVNFHTTICTGRSAFMPVAGSSSTATSTVHRGRSNEHSGVDPYQQHEIHRKNSRAKIWLASRDEFGMNSLPSAVSHYSCLLVLRVLSIWSIHLLQFRTGRLSASTASTLSGVHGAPAPRGRHQQTDQACEHVYKDPNPLLHIRKTHQSLVVG